MTDMELLQQTLYREQCKSRKLELQAQLKNLEEYIPEMRIQVDICKVFRIMDLVSWGVCRYTRDGLIALARERKPMYSTGDTEPRLLCCIRGSWKPITRYDYEGQYELRHDNNGNPYLADMFDAGRVVNHLPVRYENGARYNGNDYKYDWAVFTLNCRDYLVVAGQIASIKQELESLREY